MRLSVQYRPISSWPGVRTKHPEQSRFKAHFDKTIDQLETELSYLEAKNVVIEVDAESWQIRLDGMLRADATLKSAAIVLSFDSRFGPLRYPCDKFSEWRDNLRAITLSLEALRKVDRYGVTRQGEQYKGWDQLPAPDDRAIILKYAPGFTDMKLAARKAMMATHPDAGGSHDEFVAVSQAKQRLGL